MGLQAWYEIWWTVSPDFYQCAGVQFVSSSLHHSENALVKRGAVSIYKPMTTLWGALYGKGA